MFDQFVTRNRTADSTRRTPLRVERMECRNGPSSLLDPFLSLFDWGSSVADDVLVAPSDGDTWQPVYVGSPGGSGEVSNPIAQQPGGGGGGATLPNGPPTINNFTWTANGGVYTFTGTVSDENPAGLTVRFGGLTSLNGQTAVTDANGNFRLTIPLSNDRVNDRGRATAITTDREGLSSAEVVATVL